MTLENLNMHLSNNPLSYRSLLNIPSKINFGLELELEDIKYDEVYRLVRNQFGESWQVKTDLSLKQNSNAEIVTPVLQNRKQTWLLLKKMGKLLEHLNPTYNNCSFQVNFDGSLLPTDEDKIRFIKLYAMYEDIIYRFSKGEDTKYRESLNTYASPIILTLKGIINHGDDDIIDTFSNNKRYGLIFKSKDKNLIEFRTPNATSNPILWQNYITTFYYLLRFATDHKYNKKEIDTYINQFIKIHILEEYEQLTPAKALKLSNMIFSNKTDQLYFMHQYIGKSK